MWESQKKALKDFWRSYNNNDNIPILEATHKMVLFFDRKGIDKLKSRCTLPTFANICQHKSTNSNLVSYAQNFTDLLSTLLWNASTIFYSPLLRLNGTDTKLPNPVLLQKQVICQPIVPVAIKSWIVVETNSYQWSTLWSGTGEVRNWT